LALEAGKHVYLEKPASHNFREGQMLLAAAKKYGRTVQHGTQARSTPGMQQAMALLHSGLIGDVLMAKCWNWQRRNDIGHAQPDDPPAGVDYDTWVGPAEWMPFQKNRFHYEWHWWYNFGTGDMGNDGVHELDYAIWGLGVSGAPSNVSGNGGVYFFHDDRQWPDTQQVNIEYLTDKGPRMLIYEQRLWSVNYPYNVDSGAEFYGTKGKLFVSKRGKIEAYDDEKARIPLELDGMALKNPGPNHLQNWVDCAKNGETPNAPLEAAFCTTTAVHLGNISTRLRRSLKFDGEQQHIVGDTEANAMLGRTYRDGGHWSVPKFA
jgi:predicted dehydrogenase